jgi:Transcriptional regulator, AbiEi antitoxin
MVLLLEGVVDRNGGFFTRAQALDHGYSDRELAAACRSGVLRHIRHGAYAPARIYDSCDDIGRHLILARAALARQRGPVALAGVSAAAAHGLWLYGHDLTTVDLVRLDGGTSRNEVKARHHVVRDDIAAHIQVVKGLPVTSLARTVWEVAGRGSLEAAVSTADSAYRLDPDLPQRLQEMAAVFARWPRSRQARIALGMMDRRSGSPGESYSRVIFWRHGVPQPEPQYQVVSRSGQTLAVCDFGWEDDRHLGEFDGKIKYRQLVPPGEDAGDVVFREKVREDAVRAELWGMSRWTMADLQPSNVRSFIIRLNADLARSRRLYGRDRAIIA